MSAANAIVFEPAAALPDEPVLAAGDVHLWLAPLEAPADRVADFLTLLAPDERDRAARFHFDIHRRRFIVAHALLRTILGAYLREPAAAIAFTTGPQGKPALTPGTLHFNLAHTGDHALLGVARVELGVDLEEVRPGRDLEKLAERFFAPLECQALRVVPDEDRDAAFYRVWTRKEAYIKARGTGLSERLDGFAVSVARDEPARLVHVEGGVEAPAAWTLVHLQPAPDLMGAVALRGAAAVRAWRLTRSACSACADP